MVDIIILSGLLTGHADLNRHLTLMQIRTDAVFPLCQEDEETVLHLLGERSALSAKRVNILGSPNLSYEELGKVHWCALLRLAKPTQRFEPVRGCAMWGCALGPLKASA